MPAIKDANDYSGYSVASDGRGATLTSFSDDSAVEITIPAMWDGIPLTKISFGAFRGHPSLEKVTLPDTVRSIESNSFRACKHLESVILSRGLQTLAPNAFSNNKNLKQVTLPSSIMSFNASAFDKCPNLTDFIVYDMNDNRGEKTKRFVVARINETRRHSYMNAAMVYFDAYSMQKYDEGYGVLAEFDDRFNIAEFRLDHPDQLDDYMRREYENEIYQSIPRIIRLEQEDRLAAAGRFGLIPEKRIDEYIDLAGETQSSCMAYLLQYKQEHFGRTMKSFDL